MSKPLPYLSFVAVSRNDGHGGDIGKRMRMFVNGLIAQCNRFNFYCELILVEWNPPTNKPPLADVLPKPTEDDYLTIRYIKVPFEIHNQLAFSDKLTLFQMIAKNVGIRRARGNFILCTNVDLLFSNELFELLAKKNLEECAFYRANRCDVPSSIDEDSSFDNQLKYCISNVLKRNGKNHNYPNFYDTRGVLFRFGIFLPLLKQLSRLKGRVAKSPNDLMDTLDLDACGDFTLMSKSNWVKIQGYPELKMYSLHIDSMGIIAAAAIGLKQVIFPPNACTYHMEHSGGWEFNDPIERILFYSNKPILDWWSVREAGLHLIAQGKIFNINQDDWGLSGFILEETIIN